jgi:glycine reductase complex component B subunit gamma
VGLVARVIEEAGISTVTLNMMPAYQRSVGAPRIAAISHPFGRPFGDAGDIATQTAVLRAALRLVETVQTPGEVVHLPFQWPEEPKTVKWEPDEPSPIVAMMFKGRKS